MVKSNLFINYLFLIIFLLNNCFSQEKIVKSVSISGAPPNVNKIVFFPYVYEKLFAFELKKSDDIENTKSMHQKMYEIATAKYNPFAIGGSESIHDFEGGSENIQK